jgi:hypothetical protein
MSTDSVEEDTVPGALAFYSERDELSTQTSVVARGSLTSRSPPPALGTPPGALRRALGG